MKKLIFTLLILFSGLSFLSLPAQARWERGASYRVFYAQGPDTGKRMVCYSDCVSETDNCCFKYVFDGVTLYVEYEYNALGEYILPAGKKSKIVNTFKRLYPGAFSSEDNDLAYAVSKDGRYELYMMWGGIVPQGWLYRNGRFDSELVFFE